MPKLPGLFSQQFAVLSALESRGDCLPYLERMRSEWVLLLSPLRPGGVAVGPEDDWLVEALGGSTYYVLGRDLLLHLLKNARKERSRPLREFLSLDQAYPNDLVLREGVIWYPGHGILPYCRFDGAFESAAVVMEKGLPVGVLTKLSVIFGNLRTTGFEGAAPGPEAVAEAEPLVDVTLGAEFPLALAVDEQAELEVTLTVDDLPLASEHTRVQLSPNNKVVVRLALSSNLVLVEGCKPFTEVAVPTPEEERVLCYQVRAVQAGPALITIRLFQPGRAAEQVGSLKLRPTVALTAAAPTVPPLRATAAAYPPANLPAPDLVLYIEEQQQGGRPFVFFRITTGPGYPEQFEDKPCGFKELTASPNSYFQERFQRLEGAPFATEDHVKAVNYTLKQMGGDLYDELLSEEMRQEFKERGHRIGSIEIKTDGHHIPWEMIILPKLERDGVQREAEFLGLRYQVTRWTESYSPPPVIRLRNLVYVAPQYATAYQLSSAAAEVAYLESLKGFGVQPKSIRARQVPIFEAVDGEPFDGFHFVGHASQTVGKEFDYSSLELETEQLTVEGTLKNFLHTLEPVHVSGKGAKWGPRRPLVFLNACQTGREDVGLTRPAGWARAMLGSKAGAFVGTLWSVRDSAALQFCKTFYDALRGGKTFGESALQARRVVASTGDPSWLAYVVYAHPNARVQFGPGAPAPAGGSPATAPAATG
jgi:hypothetical protein